MCCAAKILRRGKPFAPRGFLSQPVIHIGRKEANGCLRSLRGEQFIASNLPASDSDHDIMLYHS
jgi:hypothetical protein